MKYLKPINEIWGPVLKRDLLGETREEDRFHNKEQLKEYLKSEIEKQGENVVIQNLDVSLIEDLSGLFYNLYNNGVKTLDLSGWKTSGVKDMGYMFCGCDNIELINLSGWDVSNVVDIRYMFSYCTKMKSVDLSGWKTISVENVTSAFFRCRSLKSLDLSGWDTSNVNDMSEMFFDCVNLESLNLSGWDTSKVENMNYMFCNCKRLKSLDLSGWNTSNVMGFDDMFYYCPAPYEVVNNKIVKTMNECGASGCLTFGDVSGMGDIILPGDNPNNGYDGVRGSGDLPMPSAGVYTQVAPLTLIKKKKYKNKKKKKPHHTPNPSMYDYVDDYLDYVDRTYKTIDKLKK